MPRRWEACFSISCHVGAERPPEKVWVSILRFHAHLHLSLTDTQGTKKAQTCVYALRP